MQRALRLAHAIVALFALAWPAAAQGIIRDSEIEYALRRLAAPLAAEAGVPMGSLRIWLVDDRRMNAFVLDQQTILVHSGLVLRLETAEQMQAVLAHELAHIANGHLTRRGIAAANARTAAGIGFALAALAGAAAGSGDAAAGLALGVAGSSQRVLFAHTRGEEAAADQSGLRMMARAGVNPAAAAEVLELFRGQEALSTGRQDVYVRTHPLTRDRIRAVQAVISALPAPAEPDPDAAYWFARAQAKLDGFSRNPRDVMRRAKRGTDDAAVLRRAIALHRETKTAEALAEIDALIARRPQDPFAVETKAQILYESKRFAEAARTYARAAALAEGDALILAGQGRALLAAGEDAAALAVLEKAASRDRTDARLLRDLAAAYAKAGQTGMAAIASAESRALLGRMADARTLALRAQGLLPEGSPGWRRATELIRAADLILKRRT